MTAKCSCRRFGDFRMSTANPNSNPPEAPPPDWDSHPTDLLCPLCGYNLRHLTVARCPECGFTFHWDELLEAERTKHKYLFEHGEGHSFKTFWRTWWTTCRPRKFWGDLSPAQPVRVGRLLIYWLIATCVVAICFGNSSIAQIFSRAQQSMSIRRTMPTAFNAYPVNIRLQMTMLMKAYPLPWELEFWRQTFNPGNAVFAIPFSNRNPPGMVWAIFLVLWPWLTLITLLIFRMSMRQAKIRTLHILRTVLYSCDFALLLAAALVLTTFMYDPRGDEEGWLLLCGAVVCAIITTYRLSIAFRKYLRVHLPLGTVLSTQVILVLLVFVVLVRFVRF
jgi:hypothetical protein